MTSNLANGAFFGVGLFWAALALASQALPAPLSVPWTDFVQGLAVVWGAVLVVLLLVVVCCVVIVRMSP